MTASWGSVPSVRAGAGMRLLRAAVGHGMASGRTVPVWALVVGWLSVFAVVAPLAGRERALPGIAAALAVGQLALHSVFNAGQVCASMTAAGHGGAAGSGGSGTSGLMAVAARLICGSTAAAPLTPQKARWVVAQAGLDPSAMGAPVHMPGMDMSAGTTAAGGTGGMAHAMLTLPFCSLPMFLGHLLAAVVAGWLLRRGEAALWRLTRLSVRGAAELAALSPAVLRRALALLSALAAQAAGTAAVRPRALCTADPTAARHRTVWLLRHSLARRGPPAVLAAA
jgi:hypothetical protein